MKLRMRSLRSTALTVAPHAGAWIETMLPRLFRPKSSSRPTRARGLKQVRRVETIRPTPSRPTRARGLKLYWPAWAAPTATVAPHAGAWIETRNGRSSPRGRMVAPHAGAWIETQKIAGETDSETRSRPTRARGLKPATGTSRGNRPRSRPTRARGLKLGVSVTKPPALMSRPTRARGLKQRQRARRRSRSKSRPTRARGLKRSGRFQLQPQYRRRAPRGRVD